MPLFAPLSTISTPLTINTATSPSVVLDGQATETISGGSSPTNQSIQLVATGTGAITLKAGSGGRVDCQPNGAQCLSLQTDTVTRASFISGSQIGWTNGNPQGSQNDTAFARAGAGRIEVNNGTNGTLADLISRQLFAGGDNAGIASSTSFSNATNGTVTNTYLVKGGQVANTVNTGWIKIYVGTAVAWIPYWQNATP